MIYKSIVVKKKCNKLIFMFAMAKKNELRKKHVETKVLHKLTKWKRNEKREDETEKNGTNCNSMASRLSNTLADKITPCHHVDVHWCSNAASPLHIAAGEKTNAVVWYFKINQLQETIEIKNNTPVWHLEGACWCTCTNILNVCHD